MKNIKCPCETCVTLDICQERAEDDLTIRVFRKNTKCIDLSKYLEQCTVSTTYARLHRTEKLLGIEK